MRHILLFLGKACERLTGLLFMSRNAHCRPRSDIYAIVGSRLVMAGLQLLQNLLLKLPRGSYWCKRLRRPNCHIGHCCPSVCSLCMLSDAGCRSEQGRLELISGQSGIKAVIIIGWGLQA